jgi:CRP-like cAMP-binding protein
MCVLPPADRGAAVHHAYKNEPHPLVRKMESIVDLSEDEREACLALPMMVREFGPDQDLARFGDHPSQSCIVLDGFAFRYKLCGEADRQILAFHMPGEIPDLQSMYIKTMDHNVATLSAARVGFIQHRTLFDLMARFPRLAGAFWRETLIDAAIFREWMVGMGQRRAPARIAHLFCEMHARLDAIGMADGWTVPFPVSQDELGDALGLTAVHINRALQILRGRDLITFEKGLLTIHDWDELVQVGDFEATYLHLQPKSQSAPDRSGMARSRVQAN